MVPIASSAKINPLHKPPKSLVAKTRRNHVCVTRVSAYYYANPYAYVYTCIYVLYIAIAIAIARARARAWPSLAWLGLARLGA